MNGQEVVQFFKRFSAGTLIGLGSIVPGVSGGVMAVTMGLYERILDSITHFFDDPRNNTFFLLPLGLGAGLGILAFSHVVAWLMSGFGEQILFLFIGFVAGGIPSILNKANEHGFRVGLLFSFVSTLAVILLSARLELFAPAQIEGAINFSTGLICGIILAVGTIVPGMSTSFILMYLGTYESLMRAISTLNISALIPVGIGFLLGALAIVKVVSYLFKRFRAYAYYGVLGLLVGSVILIIPPVKLNFILLVDILLFALGYAVAYLIERNA